MASSCLRFISVHSKPSTSLCTSLLSHYLKLSSSWSHLSNTIPYKRPLYSYNKDILYSAQLYYSTDKGDSTKRDLYSRLGLSPKATQSQIKETYYKLSKKYHPDRNHGNPDASNRFREISEAYSVLGDNHARRKYDRGLLREYPSPPGTHQTPPSTFAGTASQSNAPKYNFDAFYQAHYGEALKREQKVRAKKSQDKETKLRALSDVQQQLLIITVVSLVLLCGWHYGLGWYSKQLKKHSPVTREDEK